MDSEMEIRILSGAIFLSQKWFLLTICFLKKRITFVFLPLKDLNFFFSNWRYKRPHMS